MSGAPLELDFPLTCNVKDCGKRANYYASLKRAGGGEEELQEVFTLFHCAEHDFRLVHGPVVLVPPKPMRFKRLWDATSGIRCVEDGCRFLALGKSMKCSEHGGEVQ